MTSRRQFIQQGAATVAGAALIQGTIRSAEARASTETKSDLMLRKMRAAEMTGPAVEQEPNTMKIRLTFDSNAIEATLLDNATARDFFPFCL